MILLTSTADGRVSDPTKLPEVKKALEKTGLTPEEWLLIEETTLRVMKKDADGYTLALEKLTKSQEEHIKNIEQINELRLEKHVMEKENYKLQVNNNKLENPAWYWNPVVWGAVALGLGMAGGVALGASASSGGK